MREIVFLKKYQEKWKDLEKILAQPGPKDPDRLSELFIQLTDDLSYSRTYYPDSNTTKYLNTLSAQLHQEIYRNKKENSGRFVSFWKYEVPLVIARNMHIVALAFVIFIVSAGIGWISASMDDTFVRLIMGDQYVNMTEQNIEDGVPMDVYGSMEESGMFLYITVNNIYVSLLFFVLGITFGLGAIWQLVRTGIMVGAFLSLFYQHDMLADAMVAIWMHGTIEISVAIIAGAAGMVLGKSIVFPGTYSRIESVKRGAKDGLKMVLGLVPCFIIAGFIESFITRHYNYNIILSISVIFLSLAFIVTYFIVYPLYLRNNTEQIADEGFWGDLDKNFVLGGIFVFLGAILTIASAITMNNGGFILFYGMIGVGIAYLIKGFISQSKKITITRNS